MDRLRRRIDGIESAQWQLAIEYPEDAARLREQTSTSAPAQDRDALDYIICGLELLEQEERTAVLAAAAASVMSTALSDLNARLYTDLTGERVRRARRRFQQKGATR